MAENAADFRKHAIEQKVACHFLTRFLHLAFPYFGNLIDPLVLLAKRVISKNFHVTNAAEFEERVFAGGTTFHSALK